MAKDANAIRDQKIFIRLDKVLELQRLYTQSVDAVIASKKVQTTHDYAAYARLNAIEQVITMFDLPIPSERVRINVLR
jgi:hypothetical protein